MSELLPPREAWIIAGFLGVMLLAGKLLAYGLGKLIWRIRDGLL